MTSTWRSYVQVVESVLYLCPPSDTRYYQHGASSPEPSINLASPSEGRSKYGMHLPPHRLIQGPEHHPSPAFIHASPVRVTAAMQPCDHLPPLERALPYLVDTLYAELDSISRLLATRPPGSLSLGDVDVISHLIKVSSDFRECLQQSRCCSYPAPPYARQPPSPPPANSPAEFHETFDTNRPESGITINTHIESREDSQFRALDLLPSPAPLPPPHLTLGPHAPKAAIPPTLNGKSKVYRKLRAGAWHTVVSRCTAIVRGLFKFSPRSG